jgi:RimJ/RimL family protein N-acetyltransferase
MAGYVQATVYTNDHAAEVAFVLSSSFHGRGIAARATQLMLDCMERELGVTRFWVTIRNTNVRSLALAARLGFLVVPAASYPYDNFEADDVVLCRESAEATTGTPTPQSAGYRSV